ncbi:hypothetical protein ACFQL1_20475 [Halomicroarcula sp. GCM10025709]|nr:hypothetical protein [Halomicroarcula sp. YJ-61-S]
MLYRLLPIRQVVVFGVILLGLHVLGIDLVTPALDWLASQLGTHALPW